MPNGINYVTVIGAGTMGAAIAGHLANAGVPVSLLDIAPTELTAEESAAGLALESPKVRNRISQQGFERMVKSKPSNLFARDTARLIRVGNLEDDFDAAVGKSDWIIEVIVERPEPKQALMERIEKRAPASAIIERTTRPPIEWATRRSGWPLRSAWVTSGSRVSARRAAAWRTE